MFIEVRYNFTFIKKNETNSCEFWRAHLAGFGI